MFDRTTGSLQLEQPPVVVTPALTLAQFRSAPWAQQAEAIVTNPPHSSWRLRDCRAALAFTLVFHFDGQRLAMLSLTHQLTGESTSWAGWSKEAELRRRKVHDEWLAPFLESGARLPWGAVTSDFAPQTGGSTITVVYTAA